LTDRVFSETKGPPVWKGGSDTVDPLPGRKGVVF